MLVLLGEVGGADEYDVCDALKSGRITKPLVAWCIGTCASIFPFEVGQKFLQLLLHKKSLLSAGCRYMRQVHVQTSPTKDSLAHIACELFCSIFFMRLPKNMGLYLRLAQVQFGHAGACARGQGETAADKNAALAAAGAVVPISFDEFPSKIKDVYQRYSKGCSVNAFV